MTPPGAPVFPSKPSTDILRNGTSSGTAGSGSPAASAPASKAQPPQCKMSRDEFIETASNLGFKQALLKPEFKNCVVEKQEALNLMQNAAEQLDKKPGLSSLEEVSLMTMLEESQYVAPSRKTAITFYFKPDLAGFPGKLKTYFQKVAHASPRQQIVYVEFDLNELFKNQNLSDAWKTELQRKIIDQISENFRGKDPKKFSNLVFTDQKPAGKKFTTILISDQGQTNILQAKPSRLRSALFIKMIKVSPRLGVPLQLAKDYAYRTFRKGYNIPNNVKNEDMPDYLSKKMTWSSEGSVDGMYLTNNAFESEFGNPHLDGEVVVFADRMKEAVDALFQFLSRNKLSQDQVDKTIIKVLVFIACHELGHALGLPHWEEPHNFMLPNPPVFNPVKPEDEHFNAAQNAYFEAVFGKK